ncbi:MAG: hypothetical protein A2Y57_01210 [Candidatus Woykebacteria bacterium RBG_13_40_7b]|uniref:signal peptidase I n=1 Tax=Candidatus Woykebacteria bacterium RBG_13_40_7b TaxID=1802594 RepID=A0A1G1WB59_9BACT|nr:MAG: hypothetical protein A2Y57_01210 [Candidatus Woykebacteria bacterium RBG_13_40_7b]
MIFKRFWPIRRFKVKGNSMKPNFWGGQYLVAFSWFKSLKIGDVVVLDGPSLSKKIVKRIAKIKNNQYFVVGDNLNKSLDSRSFGWVKKEDILGKVINSF